MGKETTISSSLSSGTVPLISSCANVNAPWWDAQVHPISSLLPSLLTSSEFPSSLSYVWGFCCLFRFASLWFISLALSYILHSRSFIFLKTWSNFSHNSWWKTKIRKHPLFSLVLSLYLWIENWEEFFITTYCFSHVPLITLRYVRTSNDISLPLACDSKGMCRKALSAHGQRHFFSTGERSFNMKHFPCRCSWVQ